MSRIFFTLGVMALATGIQVANAADGTINFNGNVITQTCTVAVNGQVSPLEGPVKLGDVYAPLMTTAGMVQGATDFKIRVAGCTGPAAKVAAYFLPGAGVNSVSGNLINTSGTATNVELQLLDTSSGAIIKVGDPSQSNTNTHVALTTRSDGNGGTVGNAAMSYTVQYYATGPVSPGTVVSQVTYNLDYQ